MKEVLINLEEYFQGILIVLIIYHSISYYFIRDKSFISYALFLISLLLFLIPETHNGISKYLYGRFNYFFDSITWFSQTLYALCYSLFTYYFLDIKKVNFWLSKKLKWYIKYFSILSFFVFQIDTFFFDNKYYLYYNIFFFIPSGIFVFLFLIRQIYLLNNVLSKLYLIGLSFLNVFTLVSLYFTFFPHTKFMIENTVTEVHFLMIGMFVEVLLMSVGLGYKNLVYIREREYSNEKLLQKLKDNEKLKDKINLELQKKIFAKKEHINKVIKQTEYYRIIETDNKLKNEVNKLKLTSLLNQMNPHFIFNALNSIKLFIINNDAKKAVYYLNKFSKLIRKILNSSTHKKSTLKEELETLGLYVSIENIRFSNEIEYIENISSTVNLETVIVPSLILQPFVENAIWHGLSTKKGVKKIVLSIIKGGNNSILIKIRDNGIGRLAATKLKEKRTIKRKSVGIEITKERLQNFVRDYSSDYSLIYEDLRSFNGAAGTLVTLKIPLK